MARQRGHVVGRSCIESSGEIADWNTGAKIILRIMIL